MSFLKLSCSFVVISLFEGSLFKVSFCLIIMPGIKVPHYLRIMVSKIGKYISK